MKKLVTLLVCICFIFGTYRVEAVGEGTYNIEKLSYSGGQIVFSTVKSVSGLSQAISEMNKLPQKDSSGNTIQYAIRSSESPSAGKFIAANMGYVNIQPEFIGAYTTTIYNYTGGFVSYSSPRLLAKYYGTVVDSNSIRAHIMQNGAVGYVNLREAEIIPQIYVDTKVPMVFGPNHVTAVVTVPMYRSQTVDGIKEIQFKHEDYSYFSGIGVAPNWMVDGVDYYSFDGVYFYTDAQMTQLANPNDPYYNYYQYLPLRSKSKVTAAQLDAFTKSKVSQQSVMIGLGSAFVNYGLETDMNALLVYAMGAHESWYGQSAISLNKNNLFGWNAVDSSPGQSANYYPSAQYSVRDHMRSNLLGYLNIYDWRFNGAYLGNNGHGFNVRYASDPYWGQKIASIAYQIDKRNSLQDYNNYQLGRVTASYDVTVLSAPSSDASALYQGDRPFTIRVASKGLSDQMLIIARDSNAESLGYYKVYQYAPSLSGADWDSAFGYVPTSTISLVNTVKDGAVVPDNNNPTPSPNETVKQFEALYDDVRVRSGASTSGTSIYGYLNTGDKVSGVVNGEWIKIKWDNLTDYNGGSQVAYVYASLLKEIVSVNPIVTPVLKSYTALYDINYRSEPSMSGTKLGTLPQGTVISGSESDGWIKYTYNGQTVYSRLTDPNDSSVRFFSENSTTYRLGDINNDNKINVLDMAKVIRHIQAKEILVNEAFKAADINSDGKINVLDMAKIIRHIQGKELIRE